MEKCTLAVAVADINGNLTATTIEDLTGEFRNNSINANHIKSARKGFVTGKATPIHIGKKTHVWDIKIINENDDLVCVSRLTVAIIKKKG